MVKNNADSNKIIKVMTIVGVRPQFMKAAVLSRLISASPFLGEIMVHTGQHYDENMSNIFFEELEMHKPSYHLTINQGSPGELTGKLLIELEKIIVKEKPALIVVYGDTNSTLAGTLAGVKLHIPIAHVEAGIRSFDKKMPEEINRIIIDHCSTILFCPSKTAVKNLEMEGLTKNVFEVGDIMLDSLIFNYPLAEKRSDILKKLKLESKKYVLLTIHRESNTDNQENLWSVIEAMVASQKKIVFPTHPRTKKAMEKYGICPEIKNKNISCIEPVGYFDMLILEKNAEIIVTDSGSMQKEAYFLGIPCITLRDTTEWKETIDVGCNILAPHAKNILDALTNPPTLTANRAFYGDGNTGQRIVHILETFLQKDTERKNLSSFSCS